MRKENFEASQHKEIINVSEKEIITKLIWLLHIVHMYGIITLFSTNVYNHCVSMENIEKEKESLIHITKIVENFLQSTQSFFFLPRTTHLSYL